MALTSAAMVVSVLMLENAGMVLVVDGDKVAQAHEVRDKMRLAPIPLTSCCSSAKVCSLWAR